MRGTVWVGFERDTYLDFRRPGWCDAERQGHVRAMRSASDRLIVAVHMDCRDIIEALKQEHATSTSGR